jgi:hypothetical protein
MGAKTEEPVMARVREFKLQDSGSYQLVKVCEARSEYPAPKNITHFLSSYLPFDDHNQQKLKASNMLGMKIPDAAVYRKTLCGITMMYIVCLKVKALNHLLAQMHIMSTSVTVFPLQIIKFLLPIMKLLFFLT